MSTLQAVLTALAFCPHPPLLVPELAATSTADLAELRLACAAAVRRALETDPSVVCVLGAAPVTERYRPSDAGSLGPYGMPVLAGLGRVNRAGREVLPLSITLGAWLLRGAGRLPRIGQGVAAGASDEECGAVAAAISGEAGDAGDAGGRVAMLVMGDGSVRRSEEAPGYPDLRAAEFDATVAAALSEGDPAVLRGLNPDIGTELLAAGVSAWRVAGHAATNLPVHADLLYDDAPYGVGYLVASWTVRR
jgi:hypothetical protein